MNSARRACVTRRVAASVCVGFLGLSLLAGCATPTEAVSRHPFTSASYGQQGLKTPVETIVRDLAAKLEAKGFRTMIPAVREDKSAYTLLATSRDYVSGIVEIKFFVNDGGRVTKVTVQEDSNYRQAKPSESVYEAVSSLALESVAKGEMTPQP